MIVQQKCIENNVTIKIIENNVTIKSTVNDFANMLLDDLPIGKHRK